jgi:hypothetical protein
LDELEISDAFEARIEEWDLFHLETVDPVGSVDIHTVADIVWMLDEKKDA